MTVEPYSYLLSAKVASFQPMLVGGKGNYIAVEDPQTHERRDVFDALGGAAICALGHGDQDITRRNGQGCKGMYIHFPSFHY